MKLRSIILSVFLLLFSFSVLSQGLKIQGNDYVIDNRTSYVVFDKVQPAFRSELVLDFEISPSNLNEPPYNIGYILRMKNRRANTTYNILYNNQGGTAVFKFNHEGRDVLITASLDKEKLYENSWIRIHMLFDLEKDSLTLQINDEHFHAGGLGLQKEWAPDIHFGRSEHVIDVPSFALRNLTIGNQEKEYHFPLNESSGEYVHDSHKKITGHVANPNWLINKAYYWNYRTSFHSGKVAGSNYNPDTHEIYYFNEDSITFYDVHTRKVTSRKYNNPCPMSFRLGTNFLDNENHRLYVYEVAPPPTGSVTIAYLDLTNFRWTAVTSATLPTQLHHHSNYFDEANRNYIIFGGFGNASYNRNFYSYNPDKNKWETAAFSGDKITPRYFSSMGYQKSENALYIFGGMGNESGDQSVGRIYYYELYKVDLTTNHITKLWEIPWDKENMIPVRGMIIEDSTSFYSMCYPEHFSKSLLRLYRFSLKDGSYEMVGDSIPIISEKITTHANIYYNKRAHELYTIVQEFENDDIASTAKVYSISFPPVGMQDLATYAKTKKSKLPVLLSGTLIALILLFSVIYKRRKERKRKDEADTLQTSVPVDSALSTDTPKVEPRTNALYLFGDFCILDRSGKDISYMFSLKLKQAFFLILQYSLKNGISTQEFSELLWPHKPEDKMKNSRGVILNNLRKILGELDGIRLVHEKGLYRIIFDDECYCDYMRCLHIISQNNLKESMEELAHIIARGKFLKSIDIPLLDSFKETLERKLEPVLLIGMEKLFANGNYRITITLSEGVFNIDPLNESSLYYLINALVRLKMADEARRRYLLFVGEYKKTMDEDYPKSFDTFTNE